MRGLDYYTRTVFEFESERLGAQAALGGGGRYDGLVEELGGPPTPGVGWAAGRRADAAGRGRRRGRRPARTAFVAVAEPARQGAFALAQRLRRAGPAHADGTGRAGRMKGQLKQADRIGARVVVIVGDTIEVKDMDTGEQRRG